MSFKDWAEKNIDHQWFSPLNFEHHIPYEPSPWWQECLQGKKNTSRYVAVVCNILVTGRVLNEKTESEEYELLYPCSMTQPQPGEHWFAFRLEDFFGEMKGIDGY